MSARNSRIQIYGRLLREARPFWPHLAIILLIDLLAAPFALLKPVPLKIAVDNVVGAQPLPSILQRVFPSAHGSLVVLALAAALQVAVILLVQLHDLGGYVLRTHVGERLTLRFRARMFHHVQRLSLAFHDARGTADSIYRIQEDAPAIRWVLTHGLISIFSALLMFGLMIAVIARIHLGLALVALVVAPLFFLSAYLYDRRMGPRYTDVKQVESHALKVVQEVLTSVRVVKAFGREDREQERFVDSSAQGVRQRIHLSFAESVIGLIINLITALGTAIVLFIGIRGVLGGALSLGSLLLVLAYLSQLYAPMETISNQVATLQWSLAGARRAFELLDEMPEVVERPHARAIRRAAGRVEFRNVSFAYERDRVVLEDVSFVVPPGARVGIRGPTGVGKTTIVSLLGRFYDPTSGQILLDGVDLREYRLADLRNQLAFVLQEPVLFSTTIAENIAYGRPEAGQAEVVAAARAAYAHQFIVDLPDGYQTQVGERGMKLSGGERQRISLARAFLKDAPILILDEPTSAVDVRSEAVILEAMTQLMRGRTTFLVTHRLKMLDGCDVVLVLDDGHLTRSDAVQSKAASS